MSYRLNKFAKPIYSCRYPKLDGGHDQQLDTCATSHIDILLADTASRAFRECHEPIVKGIFAGLASLKPALGFECVRVREEVLIPVDEYVAHANNSLCTQWETFSYAQMRTKCKRVPHRE